MCTLISRSVDAQKIGWNISLGLPLPEPPMNQRLVRILIVAICGIFNRPSDDMDSKPIGVHSGVGMTISTAWCYL